MSETPCREQANNKLSDYQIYSYIQQRHEVHRSIHVYATSRDDGAHSQITF